MTGTSRGARARTPLQGWGPQGSSRARPPCRCSDRASSSDPKPDPDSQRPVEKAPSRESPREKVGGNSRALDLGEGVKEAGRGLEGEGRHSPTKEQIERAPWLSVFFVPSLSSCRVGTLSLPPSSGRRNQRAAMYYIYSRFVYGLLESK